MKQIEIYQWLVPIICVYFITRTILQYKNHRKSPKETILWILFWLFITAIAIIPNKITFQIANWLGFKSNVTAIIFFSLGLLYLMVYHLFILVNRIDGKLTELVRQMAKDKMTDEE